MTRTQERAFLERIATIRREIDNLKQSRSDDEPLPDIKDSKEAGAVLDDSITYESISNPIATYDDSIRGYGLGEWGSPPTDTVGRGTGFVEPDPEPTSGWGTGAWGDGPWGTESTAGD